MGKVNQGLARQDVKTYAAILRQEEENLAIVENKVKEMRLRLFENLKAQNVRRVDMEDGTSYIIAHRETLKVDESDKKAKDWLDDNYCWKPDTAKALKLVRRSLKKVPKFFEIKQSEYLRISRKGEKQDDE